MCAVGVTESARHEGTEHNLRVCARLLKYNILYPMANVETSQSFVSVLIIRLQCATHRLEELRRRIPQ